MKNKKSSLQSDFEELTALAEEFESGKLDLEESIPKFRRGLELAKKIKARLVEIENEIKEIKSEFKEVDSKEELPKAESLDIDDFAS